VSAARTLAALAAAGAALRVDGPRLVLVGPRTLPPELRAEVRAHAAELRVLLAPADQGYPRGGGIPLEPPPAAPPAPSSSWTLPPRAADAVPLGYLDTIERDGLLVLGPVRGRAPLAAPSAAVDPARAQAWREAFERRLAAGLDPESAARLTTTTHGPQPREPAP